MLTVAGAGITHTCYASRTPSGREAELSIGAQVGVFIALLLAAALANSISLDLVSIITTTSLFWHLVAGAALAVALAVLCPDHMSSGEVWTNWKPNREEHGIANNGYIFLSGMALSQWIIMAYDSR